ncbi:MAG: efflux RND transporter periplasmic adaptor subunit [Paracoccaceae bacterium]
MRIKGHSVVAIVILIAAIGWVATGEFSFVGSDIAGDKGETAEAAAPPEKAPAEAETAPAEALQTVAFIIAQPASHDRLIRISGQTEADKRVVLVARTAGAVARIPAREGDALSAGGMVMALDGADRHAVLDAAKAQFDLASHQAESNKTLYSEGRLPKLQFEASIAARDAARSAYETARAEIDKLVLRAPFSGIVDTVMVEPGSWVQPGTEIATLLSLDPIVVTGEVGERDLQTVGPGTKAQVSFGDGTTAVGKVRYVRREATGPTRTFPVEVAIANPDAKIPAGMSADFTLAVRTDPAVVLQRSAITLDTDGTLGVRILNDDDTAAFLKVEILDDTPAGLILGGIPEGVRVIVSGQDMVGNGQKVAAVPAESPATGQQDTN